MNDNDKKILEHYVNFIEPATFLSYWKCWKWYSIEGSNFMAMCVNGEAIRKIVLYSPVLDNGKIVFSSRYSQTILDKNKKKHMSYEEIISKIDANLKLYYDMQKQLLKNKINNL